MRPLLRGCLFALVVLLVPTVDEASGQAERPVQWTLEPTADAGGPAGMVGLDSALFRLDARIDQGWYLYAPTQPAAGPYAMEVGVAAGGGWHMLGDLAAPRPRRLPDRNFGIISEVYRGSAEFSLSARPVDGGDGSPLAVLVQYQACTRTYCLPPRTDTLRWAMPGAGAGVEPALVVAAPAPTAPASPVPDSEPIPASDPSPDPTPDPSPDPAPAPQPGAERPAQAQSSGPVVLPPPAVPPSPFTGSSSLPRFLVLAGMMGLLSLLTPCVLPLVPLTVGFFAGSAGGGGRGTGGGDGGAIAGGEGGGGGVRPVGQALAFGAGIVTTFAVVGLVVTAVFGAAGILRLATNPWVNLSLALLFVAFGLNLLGAYKVRLPWRLVTRLSALGSGPAPGSGAVGGGAGRSGPARLALVAGMGGAFAITSFTCTAPFVGALLVLATQGDPGWPLAGLGTYAVAFAGPFVLLALSPGALRRLPRSGAWMQTLLRAMGIIVLAAALKFVSNASMVAGWGLLPRNRFIALWLLAALVLAWVFLAGVRSPGVRRAPRLVAAGLALVLAGWLAAGLGGRPLGELEAYVPAPAQGHGVRDGAALAWWLNDYDGALAVARAEGRPLFVDFTGYTCTNCRWMEANMFPRPEVLGLMDRYVLVRLYTDGQGEPYRSQQLFQEQRFGTVALPYYAIIDGDGHAVGTFLGMTRSTQRFATFLDDGLQATSNPFSGSP
jgi:thiol:disulfide interchange protein